jgi:hypothetical protein
MFIGVDDSIESMELGYAEDFNINRFYMRLHSLSIELFHWNDS